jgi:hypothetical protein
MQMVELELNVLPTPDEEAELLDLLNYIDVWTEEPTVHRVMFDFTPDHQDDKVLVRSDNNQPQIMRKFAREAGGRIEDPTPYESLSEALHTVANEGFTEARVTMRSMRKFVHQEHRASVSVRHNYGSMVSPLDGPQLTVVEYELELPDTDPRANDPHLTPLRNLIARQGLSHRVVEPEKWNAVIQAADAEVLGERPPYIHSPEAADQAERGVSHFMFMLMTKFVEPGPADL